MKRRRARSADPSRRRQAGPPESGRTPHIGPGRGDWLITSLLLAVAGYYLLAYLAVSMARLPYPFELEWMEGIVLEHVRRVLGGQPLYAAPSVAFVALDYTPLYFYIAAGAAFLMGADFMAARLVSWLATITSMALLFALVRHETRHRAAGFLAVGLFAATYRLGGAWFDIARADALALACFLGGVCALRMDRSALRSPVLGGLMFALAVMTKQSMGIAAMPLIGWLILTDRRRGLLLAVSFGLLVGIAALLLDRASSGWFRFHVLHVALGHRPSPALLWRFPQGDLGWRFAIALILIALAAANRVARPPREALGFFGALLVGLLGSAWHLRRFAECYDNVLLTAHLGLALATAMAWARITMTQARRGRLASGVSLALVLQFALLWWNPIRQIPTAEDRAAGDRLLAGLRTLPESVFVSSHSYLATRAGKPPHADVVPFMDVVKGTGGPVESGLLRAMRDTLAAHAYPVLIMDTRDWLLDEARLAGYEIRARVFTENAFWPVTGMRTRPEFLLTPRTPADSSR